MTPATREDYGHLNDQELVYLALQSLIEEIDYYEIPQTDEDGLYGDDTAVGFCKNVLKWVKIPKRV
jgi:hypothetical protein